ncbi:MAG: hypothetical protein M3Y87_08320 [Myxococcota bacterium]|nr:hypothetical protein [Myxococcota bacterium]
MTARPTYAGALAALSSLFVAACSEPMVAEDVGVREHDAGMDASRDAGSDSGPDGNIGPPPVLCPDGCVGGCRPRRCADEPIPGFRLRPDGWYQPCNCFELDDAMGPIALPTRCRDQGLRTVIFDCGWPEGAIFHRGYTQSGPVELGASSCEHTCSTVIYEGFYAAPYQQMFVADHSLDPRLPRDRVCVPRECVFDTPGERARCSPDCAASDAGWYTTVYRVDRSACADAAGGDVDAGPPPEVGPPIGGGC